jgi:Ankyrin repeat
MQARYVTATLSVLSTVFHVSDLIYNYILPVSHTDHDGVCIIILQYLSYTMLGQDGTTALSAAARGGRAHVVALLLDAKADVNHADNVRHYAAEYSLLEY